MRLFLVRHGETEENVKGIIQGHHPGKLTSLGIEQAILLANRLKEVRFDAIYSSDLQRAADTAKEISKFQSVSVQYSELLRERNAGIFQGRSFEEMRIAQEESRAEIEEYQPLEGESFKDVQGRAIRFLKKLIDQYQEETILAVAHGRLNKLMLAHALNQSIKETLTISQANTCVNILEYEHGINFKVSLINCTRHLADRSRMDLA
jgi:broad specificity phosphatase PhoE